MTEMNYAAIDIGSNAARLLVKRIEESETGTKFTKELLLRVPLRLGFDVFGKGKISEKRGKNMMRLMKSYAYLMKIYDVQKYRACATSAMRDAKNGMELIKEIEKKTGIHIEIIGGQEEAQIVYNNHIEYMKDRTGNYLYVDVGGGSTEINLLSQGELKCSRSYNIGTVRLLNKAVKESEWTRLKEDMAELARQYPDTNIIGSGGNINKLYRLAEKKDKKLQRMEVETLQGLYDVLSVLSVEERMDKFSLKPDRADVIVPAGNIFLTIAPAGNIFLTIAGILGSKYIYVPTIGLADGIIDGLYAGSKEERERGKSLKSIEAEK